MWKNIDIIGMCQYSWKEQGKQDQEGTIPSEVSGYSTVVWEGLWYLSQNNHN